MLEVEYGEVAKTHHMLIDCTKTVHFDVNAKSCHIDLWKGMKALVWFKRPEETPHGRMYSRELYRIAPNAVLPSSGPR